MQIFADNLAKVWRVIGELIYTANHASFSGSMHYSFDYAQNLQFPADPQQPGPPYISKFLADAASLVCVQKDQSDRLTL